MGTPKIPEQIGLPLAERQTLWPKIRSLLAKFNAESYREKPHNPYRKYHVIDQVRALMENAPEGAGDAAEQIEAWLKEYETHNEQLTGDKNWAGKVKADEVSTVLMGKVSDRLNSVRVNCERRTGAKPLAKAWCEDMQEGRHAPLPATVSMAERMNALLAFDALDQQLRMIELKHPKLYQNYPPNASYQEFLDDVAVSVKEFRAACPELPKCYEALAPLLAGVEPSPTHKKALPTRESLQALRHASQSATDQGRMIWENRMGDALARDVRSLAEEPHADRQFATQSAVMDWAARRQWAQLADVAVQRIEENFCTRWR